MDTWVIEVDDNGKYLSMNSCKGTEKTSGTSKNKDRESGNVYNNIINFYNCGKKLSIDIRARINSIGSNIECYSRKVE